MASGLAIMAAPAGRPVQLALAARVLSDLGDVVVLGRHAPDADTRKKVIAAAGGWALISALTALVVS